MIPGGSLSGSNRDLRNLLKNAATTRPREASAGVVYIVTAWLAWQIVDLVVENITLPDWTMSAFQLTLVVCFPIVMVAAWLLELTPDGMRLQKNVNPAESIARKTGRQLNRGIVVILAMALVLYLTDRFRDQLWSRGNDSQPEPEAVGQVEVTGNGNWMAGLQSDALPVKPDEEPA